MMAQMSANSTPCVHSAAQAAYVCVFLAFASTPAARRQTAALLVVLSVGVAAYAYAVIVIFPSASTQHS